MNSACASEIRPRSDSPSSRDARTYGHTDRQTHRHLSFIYRDIIQHIIHYVYSILVNARLALCLASDGVLSLPIRVTMVALLSNSFCQTNPGTQETDFQLLF